MTERERVAQGPPTRALEGFPTHRVPSSTDLFRAHAAQFGPWWFGNEGGGRFDLPSPRGTCYTALDPGSAVRERIGPVLGAAAAVPESLLEDVVVSRLHLPADRDVADVQSTAAAEFGVTRELESMVPYAVPQVWALAFDRAGHHGVRYGPRFTPGESSAVAVFDDEGAKAWATDPDPVPAATAPGAPTVWPTPRRADLTVVRPPRTRVPRA